MDMKKLSLLLFMLSASIISLAQTEQGNLFLGGSGTASRTVNKQIVGGSVSFEDINIDISFSPLVGYFVADGIVVGGAVQLTSQRQYPKGQPDSDFKSGTVQFGPFARYYHSSDYFGEAVITFGNTGSEGFKNTLTNWSVGVGKAIFFNEFVAIEPMIVYQSSTVKFGPDDKNVNAGPAVKLGFAIFIQ